ncbi:MAG TPA: phospholipase D-like domain-containing protein [Acidimicrobiales bacterium]|nr:phospholipase D-like domain-containing protein [Acidimicrobiales bacterium]
MSAPARSWAKKAAVPVGAGLALTYAYGTARYRRNARRGYELDDPPQPGTAAFARLVEGATGAPWRSGNRVTILRNGDRTFGSMLDAIAAAKSTIDLSSYIIWPGEVTDRFTEAMCERAEAGVEVNVVVDAYGSAKWAGHATVTALEEAGASVVFFRPPAWYALDKLNNRMHRRLLIVDGTIGFAGGVGIADVWAGDAQDPEHWRETHVQVEGPAVRDILGGFMENWAEAAHAVIDAKHFPELEAFDDGVGLQVVRSSPRSGGTSTSQLFYATIAGARERLWVTTAYFAPDQAFVDLLCGAPARGVDVRILVNGRNVDKEVVREAGQRQYGRLLEAGVRIFEYQQTMLHAKTMVADGWANIGSSNLEHRSLGLDDELMVAFSDRGLVEEVVQHFHDDLEVSEEYDIDRWRRRSLSKRAKEAAGDLFRQSF